MTKMEWAWARVGAGVFGARKNREARVGVVRYRSATELTLMR